MFLKDKEKYLKEWDKLNKEIIELTKSKKIKEALKKALELYKFSKKYFGKKHENTAVAVNNVGFLYKLNEEYEKAESYLLLALEIGEKVYGKDSKEVAFINANLSEVYKFKSLHAMQLTRKFN